MPDDDKLVEIVAEGMYDAWRADFRLPMITFAELRETGPNSQQGWLAQAVTAVALVRAHTALPSDAQGAGVRVTEALKLGLGYAEDAQREQEEEAERVIAFPGLYAKEVARTKGIEVDCRAIRAALTAALAAAPEPEESSE